MPVTGKKIISSHSYKAGTISLIELTDTMHVVVAANADGEEIFSRSFTFTETCKKDVLKACRKCYNSVKDCISKKDFERLSEEFDD